jgi:two-component system KDP operon response regulator KdpE
MEPVRCTDPANPALSGASSAPLQLRWNHPHPAISRLRDPNAGTRSDAAVSCLAVVRPAARSAADPVSAPHVLVVDDEPHIARVLEIILRRAGYVVETAQTWSETLGRLAVSRPDALVLDLVLADGQGVELCGAVRRSSRVPILVLAAVGDEGQKLRALDAGADDFLTRPFGTDQLLVRLRAVRRRPTEGISTLKIGELVIYLAGRRVTRAGAAVHLTPAEFELVHILAQHRGRLVTDRQLLRAAYGSGRVRDTHHLRIQVAHIREKLERDPSRPMYLITEPGVGYRLQDPADVTRSQRHHVNA